MLCSRQERYRAPIIKIAQEGKTISPIEELFRG